MQVDHHNEGMWYMPSLHAKGSIGYNRTIEKGFNNKPYGCSIRFTGVALESTLKGFQTGGTGYITLAFKNEEKKQVWRGFDKNDTNKLHCYYSTNKDTGSEFIVSSLKPFEDLCSLRRRALFTFVFL